MNAAKHKYTVLQQICNIIPAYLVPSLASTYGIDKQSRSISPWSHVVAMLFTQLAHSLSLSDIADTCRNHRGVLATIRNATPPSRNGLSHANRIRNAAMAEELFWQVLSHMQQGHPKFGIGHKYSGLPRRFKKTIYAIDSTTIKLVAHCMDWARHRRRKAAAKCHMQLNLQTFLPEFAIVKAADSHDAKEAYPLCANLKEGEIAVFDKAYVDFAHLFSLEKRGVYWVTRAKTNMQYTAVGQHTAPKSAIIRDELIRLTTPVSAKEYPETLRLVEARVEIDGKEEIMTFITNNRKWAPSTVCDLYKSRWGVEVFFKQIKQTLQLADFLGHSENAVRWQIWTALLCYVLLRFIGQLGKWQGSFSRLFTLLRGVLFARLDIYGVLDACGKARGSPRMIAAPQQTFITDFMTNT